MNYRFIIVLLIQSVLLGVCFKLSSATDEVLVVEGSCQCAVFKDNGTHGPDCVPVIRKTPGFSVACDEEGHGQCLQMCSALARAAKESAPVMLCEALVDLENGFQPSVFSKACEVPAWSYTGLTSAVPICCTAAKQTACAVQVE